MLIHHNNSGQVLEPRVYPARSEMTHTHNQNCSPELGQQPPEGHPDYQKSTSQLEILYPTTGHNNQKTNERTETKAKTHIQQRQI